ncbi:hypothetical protein PTSG_08420 [Salpingoeca rosetta]|uniref:Protein kinase domain-containing protein n=1 Tax=Salpingoeca rosetta (strain ATCC 50818 / BSB-021) TaxID=946362 RepID=F2UJM7_SALR5|nr:uncharacterized protein PTSG_08420 [Salpingoeca rosetta]EGD77326.1 hypothetical protein PTSG_08420 [Salpingoeca rosetta]|eukprot:XP_004990670.1 hypothetical protein PTSG_08420 [Salpingoeca rosetta]
MDNLERYQNLVRIGRGTYGTVYKADDIGANPPCPVAIKIVTGLAESLPCFLVREISMLKSLQHPNIVQLRHLFHASGSFYLVFEAMAMDLHEYISRNPRGLSRDLAQVVHDFLFVLGCPTAEEWPALPSLPHCDLLEGNNRPLSPFSHSFHLNAEDAHLLNALVRYNPDERMTAEDAVNLPMFDLVRAYDE